MMPFPEVEEACPHSWDDSLLTSVRSYSVVHRDECAYCCLTCLHNDGTYVCMSCHAGVCWDHIAKHMQLKPAHVMYTRVHEVLQSRDSEDEMNKMHDVNYVSRVIPKEYETSVCCASCKLQFIIPPDLTLAVYNSIIHAPVPGAINTDDSNENGNDRIRKPLCPHLISLEQTSSPFSTNADQRQELPTSESICSVSGCGCTTNNWMCMTCGAVNCPRPEAGGQGHARQHHLTTDHPCSVKLGTITSDGADFYCYVCDDDVDDGRFAEHMTHFGIDLKTVTKTSKTMGELAYDYSSQFDFNKITEAGHALELAYGPGRTGIRNIGNICYLSSVVQCLMALEPFQRAFYRVSPVQQPSSHQTRCLLDPYSCRHCQTERIAAGLLSGQFSQRDVVSELNAISPRLLKQVYAQKHTEFSTGAQQDAQEYLLYILEEMRRHVKLSSPTTHNSASFSFPPTSCPAATTAASHKGAPHPSQIFEFVTERRLACRRCHGVRYTYEKETSLSLFVPLPGEEEAAVDKEHANTNGSHSSEEVNHHTSRGSYNNTNDNTSNKSSHPSYDYHGTNNKDNKGHTDSSPSVAVDNHSEPRDARPHYLFARCLARTFETSSIQYHCDACRELTMFDIGTRLYTFPDVLIVCPRRTYYDVASYSAKKLDVYVDLTDDEKEALNLEPFRGRGAQTGEAIIQPTTPLRHKPRCNRQHASQATTSSPQKSPTAHTKVGEVDELALATVMSMGIAQPVARYALQHTNMDVERAVDYIFSHPDLETEMAAADSSSQAAACCNASDQPESNDNGFAHGNETATHATGGGCETNEYDNIRFDADDEDEVAVAGSQAAPRAATNGVPSYRLVSMISHMGASAKTGHYVCHIRDHWSNRWLLFNDEKVGFSQDTPFSMASVYFFARTQ